MWKTETGEVGRVRRKGNIERNKKENQVETRIRRCRRLKKWKNSETLRFVAEESVARSRFGNQKMESTSVRNNVAGCRKVHAAVARSASGSIYNVKFGVSGGTLLKPEIFKKVPAVVARSTFRSQTGQRWTKHTAFGTLLEVEIDMFRHCTPLCREAH